MNFLNKLKNISIDKAFGYTFLSMVIKSFIFIYLLMLHDSRISNSISSGFNIVPSFFSVTLYAFFILMFMSVAFLFKGGSRFWFLVLLNTLITILLVGDLWYYRGFNSFISPHVFTETSNLDNLSSSVMSMTRVYDLIFFADVIVFIVVYFRKKEVLIESKRKIAYFAVVFMISFIYVFYVPFKTEVLHKEDARGEAYWTCWVPKQTMINLSPIGYHIFDIYKYEKDSKPAFLSQDEKSKIKNWFETKSENLPDNEYKSMFKGKNLVFIQFESLEQFVINQKIDGQEITPNINGLLKHSMYFSNIYEQVYNGTSSDADLMLNTSVLPVREGSTFFRFPNNTYNSLPKLLEGMGYSTTAIHPDKGSYWNWLNALKGIGFQNCIDSTHYNLDETIGLGISDASYFRQIEPLVAKLKQPFYSFVVTLTSHSPFDLPENLRELKLSPEMDKSYMGGYFQSMHYTDKHLGEFITKLKQDGLYDNTVFVIYGDHTGVHKYYQDFINKMNPQEEWWAKPNKRVPLIVYSPSINEKQFETIGGQVDIMPTVAYLMGVDSNSVNKSAIGRNLLNTKKSFAVLANRSYIGEAQSEEEKQKAIEAIDISDEIIKSNYFKTANSN